jgi:hypothetical protein
MRTAANFLLQAPNSARRLRISDQPPPTPKDEGLHTVHRQDPQDRIIYSAVIPVESRAVDPLKKATPLFSVTRIAIVGVVLLVLAAAGVVAKRWMETPSKYPVVVTIAVPEKKALSEPKNLAEESNPAGKSSQDQPVEDKTAPLVPITPDMLHVTSIALGDVPLTIVNGKRLGEGDSLAVTTPLGTATLRIVLIQDGLVRFRHGGETIDVKMQPMQAGQGGSPPPR